MIHPRYPVSLTLVVLPIVLISTGNMAVASTQDPDPWSARFAAPVAAVSGPEVDEQAPSPYALTSSSARAPLGHIRVPIHTGAADQGQPYGVWAGGQGYKVSFHGDMTFIPYLGRKYPHNQPLSWRTTSAKVGGVELAEAVIERVRRDYRYEYRFAGITEAYDVLAEGLEQTFVIHRLPAVGDLVITGKVSTGLRVREAPAAHQALLFCDDEGNPVTSYGAAVACDSAGDQIPLQTAHENGVITLRVPGSWLAGACLPVVVDPLLARVVMTSNGGVPEDVDIGRDDESSTSNVLMAYVRYASASDGDLFARLMNDDYSSPYLVYTDVTANWTTDGASCAFVGGADKWAVAMRRHFTYISPATSRLRVHTHAKGDTSLSTNVAMLAAAANSNDWRPDVGGVESFAAGSEVLVVFQTEYNSSASWVNTPTSSIRGVIFDASSTASGSFGQPFLIRKSPSWDCERPSVNQVSAGGSAYSWMCAMQVYNSGIVNDDWDIYACRVDSAGNVTSATWYSSVSGLGSHHQLGPIVEGSGGRYAVTYTTTDLASTPYKTGLITGKEVRIERLDWPHAAASPVSSKSPVTLAANSNRRWEAVGLGFDTNDESHWVATYRSLAPAGTGAGYFARCGYNGAITESAILYGGGGAQISTIGCVFDNDANTFMMGYGSDVTGVPVWGHTLAYSSPAPATVTGQGCSSATIAWTGNQQIGAEFNSVQVVGNNGPVGHFLVVSLATANQTLVHPAVLPGCRLLVQAGGPGYLATLPFYYGTIMSQAIALPEFLGPMTLHFQDWMLEGTHFTATSRLSVPLVR